jgi:PIN domain-containing protein
LSVVFFTDRDLGLQFPAILRDAGIHVERHIDHFSSTCADVVWLRETARQGWIALTHDLRIRYKPNELAAVIEHKASLLVVMGRAPYPELARSFVNTLNAIVKFVARHPPPMIGKVYRAAPADLAKNPRTSGRVELWYPKPTR